MASTIRSRTLNVKRAVTILTLTMVSAFSSGCGSTIQGTSTPGEIDVRTLDTGNYPTLPIDAHDEPRSPSFFEYSYIGAMRLSDHVALTSATDPRFAHPLRAGGYRTGVEPALLGESNTVEAINERNRMLFGFYTVGSESPKGFPFSDWPKPTDRVGHTTISLAVSQYVDDAHAKTAATELFDAAMQRDPRHERLTLDKINNSLSHWLPGAPAMRTYVSHGPYVVTVVVDASTSDRITLQDLTTRTLEAQLPKLDEFKALSDEQLLGLPWDSDRMLSRTLNPKQIEFPEDDDSYAIYGPHGYLHFTEDPERARTLFTRVGADQVASAHGTVTIRAADVQSAKKAVEEVLTFTEPAGSVKPPPGVPDSVCVENSKGSDSDRFSCILAYRRYIAFVSSDQLTDAHQRAAAQYAIFANGQ